MARFMPLLPLIFAGLVGAIWVVWPGQSDAMRGLGLLAWLLVALALVRELRQPCTGVLSWDGLQWNWAVEHQSQIGAVQVRMDWGQGLLLEFRPLQGRSVWLWPGRATAPAQWAALRRALHATVPLTWRGRASSGGVDV